MNTMEAQHKVETYPEDLLHKTYLSMVKFVEIVVDGNPEISFMRAAAMFFLWETNKANPNTPQPVEIKSVASLIDELISADMKCWHAQEDVMNAAVMGDAKVEAATKAHAANERRCQLMRAIDARFGGKDSGVLAKSFTK